MCPRELTQPQLSEARDVFNLFDTNGSNMLEQKDLKVALLTVGIDRSKEQITQAVTDLGLTNLDQLTYDDFVKLISNMLDDQDPIEELTKAFELFDLDKTGRITFKNLKDVVQSMGEQLTEQEIMEIISEADTRNEGDINLQEFINLLKDKMIF